MACQLQILAKACKARSISACQNYHQVREHELHDGCAAALYFLPQSLQSLHERACVRASHSTRQASRSLHKRAAAAAATAMRAAPSTNMLPLLLPWHAICTGAF
jgi:hypothetical protein